MKNSVILWLLVFQNGFRLPFISAFLQNSFQLTYISCFSYSMRSGYSPIINSPSKFHNDLYFNKKGTANAIPLYFYLMNWRFLLDVCMLAFILYCFINTIANSIFINLPFCKFNVASCFIELLV